MIGWKILLIYRSYLFSLSLCLPLSIFLCVLEIYLLRNQVICPTVFHSPHTLLITPILYHLIEPSIFCICCKLIGLNQSFSPSALLTFFFFNKVIWTGLHCRGFPGCCRMFTSIPNIYPLGNLYPPPQLWQQKKNKCLQSLTISPGDRIVPGWELWT